MWIAKSRINIKSFSGNYEFRNPGDPVPEAANWSDVEFWAEHGDIEWIEENNQATQEPQHQEPQAHQPQQNNLFGRNRKNRNR